MPQAKKPAGSKAPTRALTREELDQATARFERALEEATDALRAIRGDLGKGVQRAYKDVNKSLKTLRRTAEKTNKGLVKDLGKLKVAAAAAVTEAKSEPAVARTAARRTVARKPAASRTTTAARKPAASRATTAARKPAASRTASAAPKPATSRAAAASKPKPATTRTTAARKPTATRTTRATRSTAARKPAS